MKDILQDVVAHTHALGFLAIVKVSNDEGTQIDSMADDRSVILSATTHNEVNEFVGTFGMPNLDKLALHLKNPEYKTDAKIDVVTSDRKEAIAHALQCERVVIEEYLAGPEISLFGISDGRNIIPMQPAQDFKRAHDGDAGPNTGGMGAYSPLPWAPDEIMDETYEKVLAPVIAEMAARGTPFVGLLYAGLALTDHGLRVIEFNARFGDPETQVLIPLLKTPLATLLYNAATGNLKGTTLDWNDDSAVTVVLAAEGYPAAPKSGGVITGFSSIDDVQIYHAGTSTTEQGVVASGGRVLTVTGIGEDLTEARNRAYRAISQIRLSGSFYRTDIALNASVAEKGN